MSFKSYVKRSEWNESSQLLNYSKYVCMDSMLSKGILRLLKKLDENF